MAIPRTLPLSGPIAPYSVSDTYPTHYAEFGYGGYREVNTIDDRDNISQQKRSEGMQVYVRKEKIVYVLVGGLENDNWESISDFLNLKDITNLLVQENEPENPDNNTVWLNSSTGLIKYRDVDNVIWKDLRLLFDDIDLDFGTF